MSTLFVKGAGLLASSPAYSSDHGPIRWVGYSAGWLAGWSIRGVGYSSARRVYSLGWLIRPLDGSIRSVGLFVRPAGLFTGGWLFVWLRAYSLGVGYSSGPLGYSAGLAIRLATGLFTGGWLFVWLQVYSLGVGYSSGYGSIRWGLAIRSVRWSIPLGWLFVRPAGLFTGVGCSSGPLVYSLGRLFVWLACSLGWLFVWLRAYSLGVGYSSGPLAYSLGRLCAARLFFFSLSWFAWLSSAYSSLVGRIA